MANKATNWNADEECRLVEAYKQHISDNHKWELIADKLGKSAESCRGHWRLHGARLMSSSPCSDKNVPESDTSEQDNSSRVEYSDNNIYIVQASRRIMSQDDLMDAYGIDKNKWRADKYIIRTSEGYRKDRKVSWHVVNGVVEQGDVEDTGKMLVVPLYHMELRLVRKEKEIRARDAIEDLIKDAKNYSPKYPTIQYVTHSDGMLCEIAMPDIHFGRLTWHEESGDDFDIKIADRMVRSTLAQLLQYSKNFQIDKILLPIGNDYFNVNAKDNTTVRGTPQQEDTRWQKTFRAGRKLAINMIDTCASIAPVDILFVPGNHDEEKLFFLGDALECWYHNSDNIHIDNSAQSRKYYSYGKVLLGFAHGSTEVLKKLPNIMQFEVPKLWGDSIYREWHTGDKHHKSDYVLEVDEQIGIVIRILRSLVPADAWTFNHGFVGAQRAAEAFLWHPENGLIAQFTAGVDASEYQDD